ncbi:hypothetical protein VTN77DRAFT_7378 [Rasamsonia byssochlamydoides]|uniref:uncharacterized protein n=1 Tax=Rasamsonia byssochlamydoides TaxID=89139 RepID=UPI0037422FD9
MVSLPKATAITSIISNGTATASFDFPALREAASIDMAGNFSSLNFSQLATVSQKLAICSQAGCGMASGQPLGLSFPLLQNASGINLVGSISSLSMPVLAAAGSPEGPQLSWLSPLQPGLTISKMEIR